MTGVTHLPYPIGPRTPPSSVYQVERDPAATTEVHRLRTVLARYPTTDEGGSS